MFTSMNTNLHRDFFIQLSIYVFAFLFNNAQCYIITQREVLQLLCAEIWYVTTYVFSFDLLVVKCFGCEGNSEFFLIFKRTN